MLPLVRNSQVEEFYGTRSTTHEEKKGGHNTNSTQNYPAVLHTSRVASDISKITKYTYLGQLFVVCDWTRLMS